MNTKEKKRRGPTKRTDGRVQMSNCVLPHLEKAVRRIAEANHRSRNRQVEIMLAEWMEAHPDEMRKLMRGRVPLEKWLESGGGTF